MSDPNEESVIGLSGTFDGSVKVTSARRRIKKGSAVVLNKNKLRKYMTQEFGADSDAAFVPIGEVSPSEHKLTDMQRLLHNVKTTSAAQRRVSPTKGNEHTNEALNAPLWCIDSAAHQLFGIFLGYRTRYILRSNAVFELVRSLKDIYAVLFEIFELTPHSPKQSSITGQSKSPARSSYTQEMSDLETFLGCIQRNEDSGIRFRHPTSPTDQTLAISLARQFITEKMTLHNVVFSQVVWRAAPMFPSRATGNRHIGYWDFSEKMKMCVFSNRRKLSLKSLHNSPNSAAMLYPSHTAAQVPSEAASTAATVHADAVARQRSTGNGDSPSILRSPFIPSLTPHSNNEQFDSSGTAAQPSPAVYIPRSARGVTPATPPRIATNAASTATPVRDHRGSTSDEGTEQKRREGCGGEDWDEREEEEEEELAHRSLLKTAPPEHLPFASNNLPSLKVVHAVQDTPPHLRSAQQHAEGASHAAIKMPRSLKELLASRMGVESISAEAEHRIFNSRSKSALRGRSGLGGEATLREEIAENDLYSESMEIDAIDRQSERRGTNIMSYEVHIATAEDTFDAPILAASYVAISSAAASAEESGMADSSAGIANEALPPSASGVAGVALLQQQQSHQQLPQQRSSSVTDLSRKRVVASDFSALLSVKKRVRNNPRAHIQLDILSGERLMPARKGAMAKDSFGGRVPDRKPCLKVTLSLPSWAPASASTSTATTAAGSCSTINGVSAPPLDLSQSYSATGAFKKIYQASRDFDAVTLNPVWGSTFNADLPCPKHVVAAILQSKPYLVASSSRSMAASTVSSGARSRSGSARSGSQVSEGEVSDRENKGNTDDDNTIQHKRDSERTVCSGASGGDLTDEQFVVVQKELLKWWSTGKVLVEVYDGERFNEDIFLGQLQLLLSGFMVLIRQATDLEIKGSFQLTKRSPRDRVSGSVKLHAYLHPPERAYIEEIVRTILDPPHSSTGIPSSRTRRQLTQQGNDADISTMSTHDWAMETGTERGTGARRDATGAGADASGSGMMRMLTPRTAGSAGRHRQSGSPPSRSPPAAAAGTAALNSIGREERDSGKARDRLEERLTFGAPMSLRPYSLEESVTESKGAVPGSSEEEMKGDRKKRRVRNENDREGKDRTRRWKSSNSLIQEIERIIDSDDDSDSDSDDSSSSCSSSNISSGSHSPQERDSEGEGESNRNAGSGEQEEGKVGFGRGHGVGSWSSRREVSEADSGLLCQSQEARRKTEQQLQQLQNLKKHVRGKRSSVQSRLLKEDRHGGDLSIEASKENQDKSLSGEKAAAAGDTALDADKSSKRPLKSATGNVNAGSAGKRGSSSSNSNNSYNHNSHSNSAAAAASAQRTQLRRSQLEDVSKLMDGLAISLPSLQQSADDAIDHFHKKLEAKRSSQLLVLQQQHQQPPAQQKQQQLQQEEAEGEEEQKSKKGVSQKRQQELSREGELRHDESTRSSPRNLNPSRENQNSAQNARYASPATSSILAITGTGSSRSASRTTRSRTVPPRRSRDYSNPATPRANTPARAASRAVPSTTPRPAPGPAPNSAPAAHTTRPKKGFSTPSSEQRGAMSVLDTDMPGKKPALNPFVHLLESISPTPTSTPVPMPAVPLPGNIKLSNNNNNNNNNTDINNKSNIDSKSGSADTGDSDEYHNLIRVRSNETRDVVREIEDADMPELDSSSEDERDQELGHALAAESVIGDDDDDDDSGGGGDCAVDRVDVAGSATSRCENERQTGEREDEGGESDYCDSESDDDEDCEAESTRAVKTPDALKSERKHARERADTGYQREPSAQRVVRLEGRGDAARKQLVGADDTIDFSDNEEGEDEYGDDGDGDDNDELTVIQAKPLKRQQSESLVKDGSAGAVGYIGLQEIVSKLPHAAEQAITASACKSRSLFAVLNTDPREGKGAETEALDSELCVDDAEDEDQLSEYLGEDSVSVTVAQSNPQTNMPQSLRPLERSMQNSASAASVAAVFAGGCAAATTNGDALVEGSDPQLSSLSVGDSALTDNDDWSSQSVMHSNAAIVNALSASAVPAVSVPESAPVTDYSLSTAGAPSPIMPYPFGSTPPPTSADASRISTTSTQTRVGDAMTGRQQTGSTGAAVGASGCAAGAIAAGVSGDSSGGGGSGGSGISGRPSGAAVVEPGKKLPVFSDRKVAIRAALRTVAARRGSAHITTPSPTPFTPLSASLASPAAAPYTASSSHGTGAHSHPAPSHLQHGAAATIAAAKHHDKQQEVALSKPASVTASSNSAPARVINPVHIPARAGFSSAGSSGTSRVQRMGSPPASLLRSKETLAAASAAAGAPSIVQNPVHRSKYHYENPIKKSPRILSPSPPTPDVAKAGVAGGVSAEEGYGKAWSRSEDRDREGAQPAENPYQKIVTPPPPPLASASTAVPVSADDAAVSIDPLMQSAMSPVNKPLPRTQLHLEHMDL